MRAVVDIGTNSVRLLIAEGTRPMVRDLVITRLGRGVDETGSLSEAGVTRTLNALRRFRQQTEAYGVIPAVVATSAVREAANQQQFVEAVRKAVGWDVRILSGQEEAEYSFRGALLAVAKLPPGPAAVVDIGGGSTEILVGTGAGQLFAGGSVPVGAVRMTERYVTGYPAAESDLKAMEAAVQKILSPLAAEVSSVGPRTLIAVGGTATTLAAVDLELEEYDPEKVTGWVLTASKLRQIYAELAKLTLEELAQLKGLQPGREDIITAGTCILLTVCQLLGFDECIVSDGDLLWGIVSCFG